MRKPAFCICENKDEDKADQRLYFRYTDSTITLLPRYEISSLLPSCAFVQPGLCRTWLETPKACFLTTRLICHLKFFFIIYRNVGQEPPAPPPNFRLVPVKQQKEPEPQPAPASSEKPTLEAMDKNVLHTVDDHAIQV